MFGGELKNTQDVEFKDLSKLDFVGMYPNFAEAKKAWRARSAGHNGQCPDALFRGPYAPTDGAGKTIITIQQHF